MLVLTFFYGSPRCRAADPEQICQVATRTPGSSKEWLIGLWHKPLKATTSNEKRKKQADPGNEKQDLYMSVCIMFVIFFVILYSGIFWCTFIPEIALSP